MNELRNATPLEEFVRTTITSAMGGFPDGFRFEGPIKFKMSVVTSKEGGGGVKAYVIDLGGRFEAQEVKEIELEVTNAEDPQAHIREAQKRLIDKMGL